VRWITVGDGTGKQTTEFLGVTALASLQKGQGLVHEMGKGEEEKIN